MNAFKTNIEVSVVADSRYIPIREKTNLLKVSQGVGQFSEINDIFEIYKTKHLPHAQILYTVKDGDREAINKKLSPIINYFVNRDWYINDKNNLAAGLPLNNWLLNGESTKRNLPNSKIWEYLKDLEISILNSACSKNGMAWELDDNGERVIDEKTEDIPVQIQAGENALKGKGIEEIVSIIKERCKQRNSWYKRRRDFDELKGKVRYLVMSYFIFRVVEVITLSLLHDTEIDAFLTGNKAITVSKWFEGQFKVPLHRYSTRHWIQRLVSLVKGDSWYCQCAKDSAKKHRDPNCEKCGDANYSFYCYRNPMREQLVAEWANYWLFFRLYITKFEESKWSEKLLKCPCWEVSQFKYRWLLNFYLSQNFEKRLLHQKMLMTGVDWIKTLDSLLTIELARSKELSTRVHKKIDQLKQTKAISDHYPNKMRLFNGYWWEDSTEWWYMVVIAYRAYTLPVLHNWDHTHGLKDMDEAIVQNMTQIRTQNESIVEKIEENIENDIQIAATRTQFFKINQNINLVARIVSVLQSTVKNIIVNLRPNESFAQPYDWDTDMLGYTNGSSEAFCMYLRQNQEIWESNAYLKHKRHPVHDDPKHFKNIQMFRESSFDIIRMMIRVQCSFFPNLVSKFMLELNSRIPVEFDHNKISGGDISKTLVDHVLFVWQQSNVSNCETIMNIPKLVYPKNETQIDSIFLTFFVEFLQSEFYDLSSLGDNSLVNNFLLAHKVEDVAFGKQLKKREQDEKKKEEEEEKEKEEDKPPLQQSSDVGVLQDFRDENKEKRIELIMPKKNETREDTLKRSLGDPTARPIIFPENFKYTLNIMAFLEQFEYNLLMRFFQKSVANQAEVRQRYQNYNGLLIAEEGDARAYTLADCKLLNSQNLLKVGYSANDFPKLLRSRLKILRSPIYNIFDTYVENIKIPQIRNLIGEFAFGYPFGFEQRVLDAAYHDNRNPVDVVLWEWADYDTVVWNYDVSDQLQEEMNNAYEWEEQEIIRIKMNHERRDKWRKKNGYKVDWSLSWTNLDFKKWRYLYGNSSIGFDSNYAQWTHFRKMISTQWIETDGTFWMAPYYKAIGDKSNAEVRKIINNYASHYKIQFMRNERRRWLDIAHTQIKNLDNLQQYNNALKGKEMSPTQWNFSGWFLKNFDKELHFVDKKPELNMILPYDYKLIMLILRSKYMGAQPPAPTTTLTDEEKQLIDQWEMARDQINDTQQLNFSKDLQKKLPKMLRKWFPSERWEPKLIQEAMKVELDPFSYQFRQKINLNADFGKLDNGKYSDFKETEYAQTPQLPLEFDEPITQKKILEKMENIHSIRKKVPFQESLHPERYTFKNETLPLSGLGKSDIWHFGIWLCPKCQTINFRNQNCRKCGEKYNDGDYEKCEKCPVYRPKDMEKCYYCDNAGVNEPQRDVEEVEGWKCPACTFINHDDLDKCEICDTTKTGIAPAKWWCPECKKQKLGIFSFCDVHNDVLKPVDDNAVTCPNCGLIRHKDIEDCPVCDPEEEEDYEDDEDVLKDMDVGDTPMGPDESADDEKASEIETPQQPKSASKTASKKISAKKEITHVKPMDPNQQKEASKITKVLKKELADIDASAAEKIQLIEKEEQQLQNALKITAEVAEQQRIQNEIDQNKKKQEQVQKEINLQKQKLKTEALIKINEIKQKPSPPQDVSQDPPQDKKEPGNWKLLAFTLGCLSILWSLNKIRIKQTKNKIGHIPFWIGTLIIFVLLIPLSRLNHLKLLLVLVGTQLIQIVIHYAKPDRFVYGMIFADIGVLVLSLVYMIIS